MTHTKLLEEKITLSGLKKTFIAKEIGISRYSLIQKINNTTEFKPSEITKLCAILNITTLEEKERIFFAVGLDEKSTMAC